MSWSISGLLNPGSLGERRRFQQNSAIPIERDRDPDATTTWQRIVMPLPLRRLKRDRTIIRDLPDKVVQAAWVNLSQERASLCPGIVEASLAAVDRSEGIER
jgi:SNF2 family DNA or RNA helicase